MAVDAATRWLWQVVPVAVAGAVALVAYRALFDYRSDYAGHMLAGCGGTLFCLGVLVVAAGTVAPRTVVLTAAAAIALGALIEATIFKIAIFDPVDFSNQSLGACVAAAGALERDGRAAGAAYVTVGLVSLVGGFYFAFA